MNSMFKGILYFFYILLVLLLAYSVFGPQWKEFVKILGGFKVEYLIPVHSEQQFKTAPGDYAGGGGSER